MITCHWRFINYPVRFIYVLFIDFNSSFVCPRESLSHTWYLRMFFRGIFIFFDVTLYFFSRSRITGTVPTGFLTVHSMPGCTRYYALKQSLNKQNVFSLDGHFSRNNSKLSNQIIRKHYVNFRTFFFQTTFSFLSSSSFCQKLH